MFCTSCADNNQNKKNVDEVQLTASLDELKNDDDITWIGEIYIDCSPSYDHYRSDKAIKAEMKKLGFKHKNTYKVLKYQLNDVDKEMTDSDDHDLRYKLLKNHKHLTTYKDADLKEKNSPAEHNKLNGSIDTIITLDPVDMKETVQVVVNEFDPEDIRYFRMKCYMYYSKSEKIFKIKTVSVAPVLVSSILDSSFGAHKPLYWLPVNDVASSLSLNNENIDWATRVYRTFELNMQSQIKGGDDFGKNFITMLDDLRDNAGSVYIGSTLDMDGVESPLDSIEISTMGSSVDTIITFDPDTFAEVLQVVENTLDPSDIKKLRLIQDWSWNNETHELNIQYQGFMPIIDRVDDMGRFLYSGPAFVRRVGYDKN